MRSAVSAAFFLAMVPLGLLAAGVPTFIHGTSNAPGAVEEKAQNNYLRQNGGRARGQEHRGLISDNMSTLLDLHNDARCLHNADPLTYSDTVAASAEAHVQALTSSCGDIFHSASEDRNGYGENVFYCARSGSGSCYTPERAMSTLYESKVQADSVKEYGGTATQILWKSTTQLGCAEAPCTSGSWNYVYLVCQYNPPGNVNLSTMVETEVGLPTGEDC